MLDAFANAVFGPPGGVVFVLFCVVMVTYHVNYTLSRKVLPRPWILPALIADLLGYTWMYAWIERLYPDSYGWIRIALLVHGVVHLASFLWAYFHWPSLEKHMDDFQNRRLPRAFFITEIIYEQSDTAIYVWLAAVVLTTRIPPLAVMALSISTVVAMQTIVRSRRDRVQMGARQ